MPPKRQSASHTPATNKAAKTEYFGPEDFSNSVKKKLATSTRTGQACDRCKVRKIRCDGLPGGCSPCLQNSTDCRTTDRITGRATSRGYVENLEQENHDLKNTIRELEARLAGLGVEVKPNNFHDSSAGPTVDWNSGPATNDGSTLWGSGGPGSTASYRSNTPVENTPRQHQETNIFRALPGFRAGCHGDNYLGISSGSSYLSSIKGTALSVLGMEIDIADFTSPDLDEPFSPPTGIDVYNKSYGSFLQSAFNVSPKMTKTALPARHNGLTYAEWYFRVINPYVPILHKPTFMTMLTKIYDDPDFRPSPAETVMVHMVFAIMCFQYAARNWENSQQQAELNVLSNHHYHYSLGFFYQLVNNHTLQDLQALALICTHLRNFPKPGASWMVVNLTMSLAIELGLHRSSKKWVQRSAQKNVLEVEMRKRVFYSILAIHVTLSGKLGRPMALQPEDWDVELPEAVDDELLSEAGIDSSKPGKCGFVPGIEAFKVLPMFMDLFSTIYAVSRRQSSYIDSVNRLEGRIQRWRDQWPKDLQDSASGEQEDRVFALYLQMWYLEFRILLRHPSVSLSPSPEFNRDSLNVCVDSSRKMLHIVRQLQEYKSLDTTWYTGAVYLMAITTTLFAQWEKRNETTTEELAKLKQEMDLWLDIMGDVGGLLGSGNRLQDAVRSVTDGTLIMLSRNLASNNSPRMSNGSRRNSRQSPRQGITESQGYSSPAYPASFRDGNASNGVLNAPSRGNGYMSPDNSLSSNPSPYPSTSQSGGTYTYPEPGPGSSISYPPQNNVFGEGYVSADPGIVSQLSPPVPNAAGQDSTGSFLFANAGSTYTSPAPQNGQWHSGHSASLSWRQWTGQMAVNLEPVEHYSASALMQLGGREQAAGETNTHAPSDIGVTNVGASAQPWPLMIFDIGQNGVA
ncbi:hypothetical protein GP486_002534 [Trichoglossum hirsutum]|uniref:Zn(2)-C6 fungal-type domain-containing protein n=1 Tax=Trichoglossum hirsutum TaxID=265104 RepID=A0A9P8LEL8_9PEZI|nr:hypothetical protein GP486_002534 [Trichoglossum hirsutum]